MDGRKSLAVEFVEAFTAQVVSLRVENDRLNTRVAELEVELSSYRDSFTDKLLEALDSFNVSKKGGDIGKVR